MTMITQTAPPVTESEALPGPQPVEAGKPLESDRGSYRRSDRDKKYEKWLHGRNLKTKKFLLSVASFAVDLGRDGYIGIPGMSAVGSTTYYSIRRAWVRGPHNKDTVSIVFAGYRAGVGEDGEVHIGGASGNPCAYDARNIPTERPHGKTLSWSRPGSIELLYRMDDTAILTKDRGDLLQHRLMLPRFWASFPEDSVPYVEDTAAARSEALRVIHPQYRGPALACLQAPGGVVTDIVRDADGPDGTPNSAIAIGFDGSVGDPDKVMLLPSCAVLNPQIKVGVTVQPGTPVADFVPRRAHQTWSINQVEADRRVDHAWNIFKRTYGDGTADWLLREAVLLSDIHYNGQVLRRIEYCPEGRRESLRLIEDVRHLLTPSGDPIVQVVRMPNAQADAPDPLSGRDRLVSYDFRSLSPRWAHEFVE